MSTEPAPEPLTAEEERELRADIAHGPEGRALQVYGDDVLRLLATLDRERAATPSSVTPDLRAALRDILALAEGDAPLSEHYRREIERIARAVLASVTPSEPTFDAAPELRAALERITKVGDRPANRGKYVEHLVDEVHTPADPCDICAALAPSRSRD